MQLCSFLDFRFNSSFVSGKNQERFSTQPTDRNSLKKEIIKDRVKKYQNKTGIYLLLF